MDTRSLRYQTLMFLLQLGEIRESSLRLYLTARQGDKANGARTLKWFKENNLITSKRYAIKKTNNNRKGYEDVFLLTVKGIDVALENTTDDYYLKNYKSFKKIFTTRQGEGIPFETERIEKALNDNDIASMFSACGVPVFKHEKPSLIYLKNKLSGSLIYKKRDYLDSISEEECKACLKNGIYYSMHELMDYALDLSKGLTDTITGTRARGAFISDDMCYPVYVSKKYDNRLLKINKKGERGLLQILESLRDFTGIYKNIPEFDEYTFDASGKRKLKRRFTGSPYAIIFSDGAMLPYAVSTGNAKGKIKDGRMLGLYTQESPSALFTASGALYARMFMLQMNINGFYCLNYLLTHSMGDYKKDGLSIFENDIRFSKEKNSLRYFPYVDQQGNATVFMPVIEARTLYALSKVDTPVIFATFKDHMDVIARSVRRDIRFYDVDRSEFVSSNVVMIYGTEGYPKGELILDSYLKSKGLSFNKKVEGRNLPARFNMDYISFYNSIARGMLKPSDIEDRVITKQYDPATQKKSKPKIISCSLEKSLVAKLKEESEKAGCSVSSIIASALKYYWDSH